jgi:hypothetical protein
MTGIPVLHVQVRVEPGRTGSLKPHAPPPRSDTQGLPHGQQAQAEHSSRGAETAASGPRRTPAGLRAAGRQSAVATIAAGSTGSRLPDAYIGAPQGDLRSDPQHAGVLTDKSGQRYIAAGKHYYAIRNDPENETWRVVQLQDGAKPGIGIRRDMAGEWQVRHDIGLPGGRPLPTHAQVENDLRETRATLGSLLVRRLHVRQNILDDLGLLRRYETFRTETRTQLQSVREDIDFWQGMSEYFAGAVARRDADPSFQSALDEAHLAVERKRNSMQALQRMIDEADAHIGTLQSRIDRTGADLEHIRDSIPRANQRIAELAAQLNDFG